MVQNNAVRFISGLKGKDSMISAPPPLIKVINNIDDKVNLFNYLPTAFKINNNSHIINNNSHIII